METTKNFGLKKPDLSDFYNVGDFNDNADIIDQAMAEIKENSDKIKDGTLKENNFYVGNGFGSIYADEDVTRIEHFSEEKNSDNCTQLIVNDAESAEEDLLELSVWKNGVQHIYKLYGEHNPPVVDSRLSFRPLDTT